MKRGPGADLESTSESKKSKNEVNELSLNEQLFIAISNGSYQEVQNLIDQGAEVNQICKIGFSPLYVAAEKGHTEIANLLLDSGANVNLVVQLATQNLHQHYHFSILTQNGNMPLHIAVKNGHTETVELLLKRGALVNQGDTKGNSPLYMATDMGHSEIAKLLIENHANVNQFDNTGETPLQLAAHWGDIEIVKLLIERGANVNSVNLENENALYFVAALRDDHKSHEDLIETAKLLIAKGANVNQANRNGKTPLHALADYGRDDDLGVNMAMLLINNGAIVDWADDEGTTPLLKAADHNAFKIAKLLVEKGANVNQIDNDGCSPLSLSVHQDYGKLTKLLISYGANLSPQLVQYCSTLAVKHNSSLIILDACRLESLIAQTIEEFQRSLPFKKQLATTEHGVALLKKNLFRIMYPRIEVFLSSYQDFETQKHFIKRLAKHISHVERPSSDCFDSFLIQNNTFSLAGRALASVLPLNVALTFNTPTLPMDIATKIAGYVPGYDRAKDLFESCYGIEQKKSEELLNNEIHPANNFQQ
jgi:ankyrin repeat protein